nr:hypothetical protein [Tanacetum cinerariifolium]
MEYHAPSNDDIQVEDDDEDPEEEFNKEHEPKDEDTREPSEDFDETEPFEEDDTAVTPPPPRHRRARIFVRPQTPMDATQALIDAFVTGSSPFPLPPTIPAYDQAPSGHKAAMIRMRDDIPKEDMPPQRRFTIARAADRAKDVGYVRALQASEHRMMTSIKEVNLRVSYQAQVRRQEMRGQRTAYETELQEVYQAYLSFEARNRALLARLETPETHISCTEWQR